MPENIYMVFIAAVIPLLVGMIYYHPALLGGPWMRLNDFTEASLKKGNPLVLFGISYLFSVMLAFILTGMTIHQTQVASLLMPEILESGSDAQALYNSLMADYGDRYRSFKHGMLHGGIAAVFFALPLLGINALFERRGWTYIFIHFGYWFLTLVLMSGLLCHTLRYAPMS